MLFTMSWRQWSITAVWFAAVLRVVAQTSPITQCIPSFDWSINSLQQTPCLVAAYLESACGTPTMIPAVPVGDHYLGPNATQADPCRCSTVTYSAISACAGCQNRTYIDWLTWSQDCTSTFLSIFPESLPSGVEVPLWAYINLTLTNNNFSVIAAEEVASETLTTSSAVTTSTSISNSLSSSSTVLASPSLASPSSTSAGNSKSNAGAIAGGVVGGIGLVAIVGLGALWFFLWRKRNKVQKNVAFDRRALVSGRPGGMSQTTGSTQGVSPFPFQPSQSIYTSDASLYPGTPLTTPGTVLPTQTASLESSIPHSVAHFGGGPQNHANVPVIPRGYTGMPEI